MEKTWRFWRGGWVGLKIKPSKGGRKGKSMAEKNNAG